jgi:aminopeptidase N
VFDNYDASRDGFDIVRDVFTRTTGTDKQWFFDQWFFQSGVPNIATAHTIEGDEIVITLRQLQKQQPFRLNSEVAIRGVNGEVTREKVLLDGRETRLKVKAMFAVRDVVFDPDDRLLLRRAQ